MEEIPAFWVGAQAHAQGEDLLALAERAGGWAALEASDVEGLVALGVALPRAVAWKAARPRRTRGRAVWRSRADYPERLREIPDAPPVLCVDGAPDVLEAPTVAIVGTRSCTAYGAAVARHLSGALASAGVVVVSGLARGIDAHAHRAAVEVGRTVAVVAHGLDHTAPAAHRRLRRELLDAGGAVVSTHPDDLPPRPYLFPARNRWIAALADVVVVVEAGMRSGARITAREAAELDRDVVAVPGPLGAPASRGCLELVAEGAGILTDVEEWVARWTGRSLAPRREAWLEALFSGRTVDDVARSTGRSAAEILASLTRLELEGEVVRLPGGRYAPTGSPR